MSEVNENKIRHTIECDIEIEKIKDFLCKDIKPNMPGTLVDISFTSYFTDDGEKVRFELETESEREDIVAPISDSEGIYTVRNKLESKIKVSVFQKFLEGRMGFPIEGKIEAFKAGWINERTLSVPIKIVATKEDRLKELSYSNE